MIGIYGGSFNPIHVAHLRAAEEAAEILGLDRVVFIPSARPPHKSGEKECVAPAAERLAWVQAATADNPRFEIDAVEMDRPGPSFLVDTLTTLAGLHPGEERVFLLGYDALCDMGHWREPRTLFTLSHFGVLRRPGQGGETLAEGLPECVRPDFELSSDGRQARHRRAGTWIRNIDITSMDVSASAIRDRIRDGRSIRYLVPDVVHDDILASKAYAEEARR